MNFKGERLEDSKNKDAKLPLSMRRIPVKAPSTRRLSLSELPEEAEAEIDPEAIRVDEGVYSDLRRPRTVFAARGARRQRPSHDSTRGPPCRRSSVDSGDSSLSLSSIQSRALLEHEDSINVMDFGVDHQRQASLLNFAHPGVSLSSFSHLVDSSGFLGWDHASGCASESSSLSSVRDDPGPLRRASSLDTAVSEFSGLVDSEGFMGWRYAADDDTDCKEATADTQEVNKAHAAQDDGREDTSEHLNRSWRIEDYEDSSDTPRQSGSILSKVLSQTLSLKTKGATTNAVAPAEAIGTGDIKRYLLEGRPGDDRAPGKGLRRSAKGLSRSAGSGEEPLRHSGLRSFFGGSRPSDQDLTTADRERRINREDGVDIGELRRELCAAGSREGKTRRKINTVFF